MYYTTNGAYRKSKMVIDYINIGLTAVIGVIDSDYRGEIMVALYNHSNQAVTIAKGDRVAQLVIAPYIKANFQEVDELEDTVRGEGGFGSTGTK